MRLSRKKKNFKQVQTISLEHIRNTFNTNFDALFIDIEDELKKAEIKFDEEVELKKEQERKRAEYIAANPRNVVARMKNYNKEL
jgi:GTPase SAR1 family protein